MKLYIDVDGVLLGKASINTADVILSNHAKEFLEFCLEHFECYWLSTHCKDNNSDKVLKYLSSYVDAEILKLLLKIKPTKWDTLKTEAIDFESEFFWIDDAPLYNEKEVLMEHGVFDRWIEINTRKNPDDLIQAIDILNLKIIGDKNE